MNKPANVEVTHATRIQDFLTQNRYTTKTRRLYFYQRRHWGTRLRLVLTLSEYTKNRMSNITSASRIISRTMKNCERESERERARENALVKTGTGIRAVIFILTSMHVPAVHPESACAPQLCDALDSYSILDRNAWAHVYRYKYIPAKSSSI